MSTSNIDLALWLLLELWGVDRLGEFIEQSTFVAVLERVHGLAQVHIADNFMVPGNVAKVTILAAGN